MGIGIQLQARKLPADSDQQAIIAAKFDSVHVKIATWQKFIDEEPITFEEIKNDHGELKGAIHSLYQEALYARVTDKLSYDIIKP